MIARPIAAAVLLAALGGCTLFKSPGASQVASSETELKGYFDERIAAGRQFLKAGLPSRAVVAFRQASYNADHAAEAYNGMGVAYSMMGRHDVAKTLFDRAIAANPYDQRFARNLARLERQIESRAMLAAQEAPSGGAIATLDPDAHASAQDERPTLAGEQGFSFPRTITSSGGLSYRPAKETRISTVAHDGTVFSANPDGRVVGPETSTSLAAVPSEQQRTRNPAVTVFKPRKDYPVRVAITGRKRAAPAPAPQRKIAEPEDAGYPVRVALGSASSDDRN